MAGVADNGQATAAITLSLHAVAHSHGAHARAVVYTETLSPAVLQGTLGAPRMLTCPKQSPSREKHLNLEGWWLASFTTKAPICKFGLAGLQPLSLLGCTLYLSGLQACDLYLAGLKPFGIAGLRPLPCRLETFTYRGSHKRAWRLDPPALFPAGSLTLKIGSVILPHTQPQSLSPGRWTGPACRLRLRTSNLRAPWTRLQTSLCAASAPRAPPPADAAGFRVRQVGRQTEKRKRKDGGQADGICRVAGGHAEGRWDSRRRVGGGQMQSRRRADEGIRRANGGQTEGRSRADRRRAEAGGGQTRRQAEGRWEQI
eukprot:137825-Chlamydomonas_euryale.AAC.1